MPSTLTFLAISFLSLLFLPNLASAQGSTCSASIPCYQGCCSSQGFCGFGPDYCGSGCQGSCDAKAECGQYAPAGKETCPLNVCCSKYGYCGTTDDFCSDGCQSNCGQPKRPSCSSSTDLSQYARRIGYYELFGLQRPCDGMQPEDLAVGPLTHLNLAFALFDSNFNIQDTQGDLIRRLTFLKARYAGLKVMIAIGGWAFNDPPTQSYFSNMASTQPNRQKFISSLISFIQKYGLDGVDIDWEYPAALDRGGVQADTANFVLLMSEIRQAFDAYNPGWEATITIPTSYWYLRGFDLPGLQKYVSWFNLMSYDLHGGWDQHNKYTGPYLEGHTNITEIDTGLDLLWRNGVLPQNVVMGYAFYGRSFTMKDITCSTPGCQFSTTGRPGDCSVTSGVLLYEEVVSRNSSLDVKTVYDPKSTVKYNVFDGNQWVSYDDAQSFTDKKKFMSGRCLSGLMIWAIDQDTPDYQALAGLIGEGALAGSLLEGGNLDSRSAGALSDAFGAYTGQNCFVTTTCTDGSPGQQTADQTCPAGTVSIETAHAPLQAPGHPLFGQCDKGWYRNICCPVDSAPKNCKWNGAPVRSEFGCSGKCGSTQFLLASDPFTDANGNGQCYSGKRSLCCDSTTVLEQCFWTGCQGPIGIDHGMTPTCPTNFNAMTYRYDQDNGDWCSATYVDPLSGSIGSPVHRSFARALCCPSSNSPQNCHWSNSPPPTVGGGTIAPQSVNDPDILCKPTKCSDTETQFAEALIPPVPQTVSNPDLGFDNPSQLSCDGVSIDPAFDPYFPYCCEPPTKYSDDWPVDPKFLFSTYYDQPQDDVLWHYSSDYANNDADPSQSNPGSEDGTDAYGFVMLDGPAGSLDSQFATSHTVVTRDIKPQRMKRSIVTTDQAVLNATFDHAEETVYIYCNYPERSAKCRKVWYRGVEDTIIKLPDHIGEGPFARIVSMVPAESDHELPSHHLAARSASGNRSPIYKLTFDYNFHLSKRGDPIEMRVDFTNLLDYWGQMTNAPASKKRSVRDEHVSKQDWHEIVNAAKEKHALRKRSGTQTQVVSTTEISLTNNNSLSKRWFGKFVDWLKRLNTFESKEVGTLELALEQSLLLFKAAIGCPGNLFYATISMFFDTQVKLDATYAYYFSGTILPPSAPDTYVYFSLDPSAYMGLRLVGNARMQTKTDRKKLIDTLAYPGLSVKGLATVGPTLDIYGEIRGVIQLKGEMRAGVQVDFAKAEVYWPQNDAASNQYQTLLGLDSKPSSPSTQIAPTFDVAVTAQAQLDVLITPQANIGIQIGGTLTGGSIVNAQLYGNIPTDLQFIAIAQGTAGSGSSAKASYLVGVYFYYNVAFGAVANILGLTNWASGDRTAYANRQRYTIFEKTDSFSPTKRSIDSNDTEVRYPRKAIFDKLTISALEHDAHDVSSSDQHGDAHHNSSLGASSNALLLGKRAGSNDGDLTMPDFGIAQVLTCPPGGGAQWKLPDYRLNCNLFRDQVLVGGAVGSANGICTNVQNFFRRRGLANSESVLTWDPFLARKNSRFASSCPSGTCSAAQSTLQGNFPGVKLSCDEYPFASSEEGGSFLSTLGIDPTVAQTECVPAWQNNLQGNCNKILSQLQTNVAYFERSARGDQATIWSKWTESSRTTESAFMKPNQVWTDNTVRVPQRIVLYPNQIPQGAGISDPFYAPPDTRGYYGGYMFRRNFTFGLARPANPTDGAAWSFDGTAPTTWNPVAGTTSAPANPGDMTQIVCAVNTFAQTDIYRYVYNGLCFNGGTYDSTGWGTNNAASRCIIDFGPANAGTTNAGGSRKRGEDGEEEVEEREVIGNYNGWNIYGIKMLDDDDEGDRIDLPGDLLPSEPLMPFEKVSVKDLPLIPADETFFM